MVKELPEEYQKEVEGFVRFLSEKKAKKKHSKPSFKCAGALKDIKDQYTSVGLQHKASEWRDEDVRNYLNKTDKK